MLERLVLTDGAFLEPMDTLSFAGWFLFWDDYIGFSSSSMEVYSTLYRTEDTTGKFFFTVIAMLNWHVTNRYILDGIVTKRNSLRMGLV